MAPHRKTCKRYDTPGDAHFLTFSCFRRLPLLDRDRSRRWLLQALRLGQTKQMFDLWAYVIMPEHVHVILLPRSDARIAEILSTIKQSTSKRALVWLRENAPDYLPQLSDAQPNGTHCYRFWQRGGGYDRNLRSVRDVHEKIRYIHENPVRRGLVKRSTDWHWSSAAAWSTGIDEPIAIDRDSAPSLTILDERTNGDLMNVDY
ncbi:Transposase IS200 like protein [Pirellulimonas nuda]|uniref:Transposase IS200 like protein n=1 Tax=Pirellulimonas nuda TaxID=2528009 RepID=A0A518D7E7_9BACT|nr:transposase [Pirellulimonas nuda]QDU87369.1 Transposase IS200 like protein [Pirellulimonas nuda]